MKIQSWKSHRKIKKKNQKYNNIKTVAKSQCIEHGKKVTIIIKRNWKSLFKKKTKKKIAVNE